MGRSVFSERRGSRQRISKEQANEVVCASLVARQGVVRGAIGDLAGEMVHDF
jgi:hypothetical protein